MPRETLSRNLLDLEIPVQYIFWQWRGSGVEQMAGKNQRRCHLTVSAHYPLDGKAADPEHEQLLSAGREHFASKLTGWAWLLFWPRDARKRE